VSKLGVDNLENVKTVTLEADDRAALLARATECMVVFSAATGWPTGIVMSFLHSEGTFWLTATDDRAQVTALAADPRMSIVVTNAGTGTVGRQMISFRGVGIVHRDRETLDWFLPRFTKKLSPHGAEEFARLLDSPKRVVIEVKTVAVSASHDSRKMPGDGRGGPAPAPPLTP
jgi:general stress protein 26